jgi:diguanylate cyclase
VGKSIFTFILQECTRLILGSDNAIRARTKRLAQLFFLNAMGAGLLIVSTLVGLTPVWASVASITYSSVGVLLLYIFLRTGWTAATKDPSLAYPTLLFALSAVVVCYSTVEIARGVALQLICLILAVEMDRISARRLLIASLSTVAILVSTSAFRLILWDGSQFTVEVYNLLMAGILLPVAVIVGSEIARIHRLQAQQHEGLNRALKQLNELSIHDALTGAANRRQMQLWLAEECQRKARSGEDFCIAMLDIDWFKSINDTYGHAIGDIVLQQFARLIRATLDPADRLARWGGEEFLILMPACRVQVAHDMMKGIHMAMSTYAWHAHAPPHLPTLKLKFSAGLSQQIEGEAIEVLLARADGALYEAKALGRNQTVVDHRTSVLATQQLDLPVRQGDTMIADPTATINKKTRAYSNLVSEPKTLAWQLHSQQSRSHNRSSNFSKKHDFFGNLWQTIIDATISKDPTIREHLRLPLIASVLRVIWICAMLMFVIPSGQIVETVGYFFVSFEVICLLGFYSMIRFGWSKRFSDKGLVLVQMQAASFIVAFGYLFAPILRPSLLHLFCVIQVFGMATLKPRESWIAGITSVLLLLLNCLFIYYTQPNGAMLELIKLTLTCYVVIQLARLSLRYSTVRKRVIEDQKDLKQAVEKVHELVIRDTLTGLFNRKHMIDLITHERERQLRTGQQFSVALLDLDHFKQINDTYGHQVGDQVLVHFSNIAQLALRETDVIGRWGGEEFLILMRDTDPQKQGSRALSRLRLSITELHLPAPHQDLRVTFSAGLAGATSNEHLQQTIERADAALYRAKAAGRNRDQIG